MNYYDSILLSYLFIVSDNLINYSYDFYYNILKINNIYISTCAAILHLLATFSCNEMSIIQITIIEHSPNFTPLT